MHNNNFMIYRCLGKVAVTWTKTTKFRSLKLKYGTYAYGANLQLDICQTDGHVGSPTNEHTEKHSFVIQKYNANKQVNWSH